MKRLASSAASREIAIWKQKPENGRWPSRKVSAGRRYVTTPVVGSQLFTKVTARR